MATLSCQSGIFAAVRGEELTLTVTGFRDGVEVAEQVFTLTQNTKRLRFGRDFRDPDIVQFRPSGTFDGSNPFEPLAGNFFAVDNLAIRSADADPFG